MHDSNMSDSQFMRFQKKKLENMKKYMDNFDNDSRIRQLRKRFEAGKGKKKTLWEKIKEWIIKLNY